MRRQKAKKFNPKAVERKRAFDAAMASVSAELARQKTTEKAREEPADYRLLRKLGLTAEQCLRQATRLEGTR